MSVPKEFVIVSAPIMNSAIPQIHAILLMVVRFVKPDIGNLVVRRKPVEELEIDTVFNEGRYLLQ